MRTPTRRFVMAMVAFPRLVVVTDYAPPGIAVVKAALIAVSTSGNRGRDFPDDHFERRAVIVALLEVVQLAAQEPNRLR